MKVSAAWINSYLQPGDLSADQMEQVLTFVGLPIESIEALPARATGGGGTGGGATTADARLDVEVTSNRGDCLCHVGLAREIAAATGRRFVPPAAKAALPAGDRAGAEATLRNEVPEACPLFTLRLIRGVKVGPSPAWLAEALTAAGARPINNVVDATNFVLLEMGQPSHAFDLAKVAKGQDGRPGIIVRTAKAGEKLTLLDGRTITLAGFETVVADESGPVSLAGVMGGEGTSVTAGTTEVLVEVATWDPVAVRSAARKHGIRTDSSYRYERTVPAASMAPAADRLADLIVQIAGGTVVPGMLTAGKPVAPATQISLRPGRCRAVIGANFSDEQMRGALTAQGFAVAGSGESLTVTVPAHRPDVRLEIDLIEEVARTVGYDRIPLHGRVSVSVRPAQTTERAVTELSRVLTGAGFYETVTFSFTSAKAAKPFLPVGSGLRLTGVSEERRGSENICRPSVLAGLLECRRANQDAKVHAPGGVRLFEMAGVFADKPGANGPGASGPGPSTAERAVLALLADAPTAPGLSAHERRQAAFALAKGTLVTAAETLLGGGRLTVRPGPTPHAGFEAAATAQVLVDGAVIGHVGLVSAEVQRLFDLEGSCAAAEVDLEPLLAGYPPKATVSALPRFPATDRDLSVIVDEGTTWAQVEGEAAGLSLANIESTRFVTTYRGKPLAAGKKSVTLRMVFRHPERTLRDDEVNAEVERLVTRLKASLKAEIRTA